MKPLLLCMLLLLLLTAGAVDGPLHPTDDVEPPTTAPAAATQSVRFMSVDVTLDPKGRPLAAYQLQFDADPQRVKLVGIEGGDHAAFREPPYYDPAALNNNRVVLAAFNTGSDLPSQSFRAARLHLQIAEGEGEARWQSKLIVATTADGTAVDVGVVTRSSEGAAQ